MMSLLDLPSCSIVLRAFGQDPGPGPGTHDVECTFCIFVLLFI